MPEAPPETGKPQSVSAIAWFSAWALFLLILLAIAKTPWGRPIVYYLAWLAVIFLLVSHYQEITDLFTQGGITGE